VSLRFAVFGSPVRHSLSPRIHAAFAAQCGIALEYGAVDVTPEQFPEVLTRFHAEGGCGGNVTLPLKELAAAQVQAMDSAAERAGAVNTLIRRGQGWDGANTDGLGFIADLRRLGVRLSGARVVVLGAGGAARGVVGPLLDAGVSKVSVVNRSLERAQALALRMEDKRLEAIPSGRVGELAAPDLLVNALSVGHAGSAPVWPESLCSNQTVAYDLSYGKAASGFLGWAQAAGAIATHDGLGMLVEQAAEAFALWHGVRPDGVSVLAKLRGPD
jgi:shikimate dehydrogenase